MAAAGTATRPIAGEAMTQPHDDPGRVRLAVHEAGHCVAAVLVGRRVDSVSIELGKGRGVCHHRSAEPVAAADPFLLAGNALMMPWASRGPLEAKLATLLAGAVAESTYGPPLPDGYVVTDPDELYVRAVIEHRQTMPDAARENLERVENLDWEADELGDWPQAHRLACMASSGWHVAGAYLAYLHAEVAELVLRDVCRLPLRDIALALIEHGELDGATVHAIVEAAIETQRKELLNAA
jgi:hypothetical protein